MPFLIAAGGAFALGFAAGRASCGIVPRSGIGGPLTVAMTGLALYGGYSLVRKVI